MTISALLKNNYKSPFTATDVYLRDKPVATDTIYSETSAIDDVYTCSQLFVVTKSLVLYVYVIIIDKQFLNALEENIRARGEMSKFISDNYQSDVRNHAQIFPLIAISWCLKK